MIIPRRKGLLTVPDEIRRASLIAAPIALFGGSAALADTAFTKFSFPATGARANRTMPDRLSDIFNVKDFGALGNWNGSTGNDDTSAIQAAINAATANGGGIVFFPPGTYHITSRLTAFDSRACMTLLGSGPGLNAISGTTITGNFNDWLFTTEQMNNAHQPVKIIQGISFQNINRRAPVSTDVTPGCIRMSSGIGVVIRDCEIDVTTGIGIYLASQNNYVTNTNITGGYPSHTGSIGAWINNSWIENCKIQGLDIGIILGGNGFVGGVRNVDIEVSGDGILVGLNPYPWYDSNQPYPPLQVLGSGGGDTGIVENVGIESPYRTGMRILTVHNSLFQNIKIAALQQVCTDGILIDAGGGGGFSEHTRFSNIYITSGFPGGYSHSGVTMGQQCNGCIFETVRVQVTNGGGTPWILPTQGAGGAGPGTDPYVVVNCENFSGAMPFSLRYLGPTAFGMTSVFSDSFDPVWTGTASNVGKSISGGGTHTVLGRWDGRRWVIAG
jgi:hypothetical protein